MSFRRINRSHLFSFSLLILVNCIFFYSVVEANGNTGELHGTVSMSAQFAPYDAAYGAFSPHLFLFLTLFTSSSSMTNLKMTLSLCVEWNEVIPEGYEIWPENYGAHINTYKGGIFQQAVSALPETDQLSYELLDPTRFNTYGFEYQPSVCLLFWFFSLLAALGIASLGSRFDEILMHCLPFYIDVWQRFHHVATGWRPYLDT